MPRNKKKDKIPTLKDPLQPLLDIVDLPTDIKDELIKNAVFEDWSEEVLEKVLKLLKKYLLALTSKLLHLDNSEETLKIGQSVLSCVTFLKHVVDLKDTSNSVALARIYSMLAGLLISEGIDFSIRNQMCSICEKLTEQMTVVYEGPNVILIALFLFELTLGNKCEPKKTDIKRIWSLHRAIELLDLSKPECENLVQKLIQSVTNKSFLNCKEGRQHISHFLSMDTGLHKSIQKTIRDHIPNLPKKMAAFYGEIYFSAWNNAQNTVRKEIEQNCIQDLMVRIFTIKRSGMDFEKTGQNVMAILSQLHSLRRTTNFSFTITNLYTPLIWRHLRSGNPFERCNAAQVFMDVFPLENPKNGKAGNAAFKERQFKEMMDLLMDDYHIVRMIAIKGVCYHLRSSLACFSILDVKTLLKTLVEDLANDGSCPGVRAAVYEGFLEMVQEKNSAALLESILPQMTYHIHDENEKVRCAFVRLLLAVKGVSHMELKYWHVVPIQHLAARLALENLIVGKPLVELMMSNIYYKGMPLETFVQRIVRLVHLNLEAAKKLLHYSKSVLTFEDAYNMLIAMLSVLRKKGKKILDDENPGEPENQKVDEGRITQKRKHSDALTDISNEQSKGEKKTSSPAGGLNDTSHDEELYRGLMECICILWGAFTDEINSEEYASKRSDLYTVAVAAIVVLIRAFKGSPLYYSTIYFASLVPIEKLAPISTISGACLSELRSINSSTREQELECLTYSLCTWNRGHEVIELAMEWLDHGMRSQQLNATAVLKEGKRKTRVRFQPSSVKPVLALKLLDSLFSNILNEKRLINKSYNYVYDLYAYLEKRLKVLIEKRLEGNLKDENLSDEFLVKGLRRQLELAICLHRPSSPPEGLSLSETELLPHNAAEASVSVLLWATGVIVDKFPSEVDSTEPPLEVLLVQEILRASCYTVGINVTDRSQVQALSVFILKILSLGCNAWFIEDCIMGIDLLTTYAEVHTEQDEWMVLSAALPALFGLCLEALFQCVSSSTPVKFKDQLKMRNELLSLPMTLQRLYEKNPDKVNLFENVFDLVIMYCLNIISIDITKTNTVEVYKKWTEHSYWTSQLMRKIIAHNGLCRNVLPSLRRNLVAGKQDAYVITSCLSLFNTIVHNSKNRFKTLDIETMVQFITEVVLDFKPSKPEDSFSGSDSLAENIKETLEPILIELGQHIGCAIRT